MHMWTRQLCRKVLSCHLKWLTQLHRGVQLCAVRTVSTTHSTGVLGSLQVTHGDHVHIRDVGHVEQVLGKMAAGGREKLQVISDFDHTLSRSTHNGVRCPMTHDLVKDSRFISESNQRRICEIWSYYYPKEISTTLPLHEKIPLMVEFWNKIHDIFLESDLSRQAIRTIVRESDTQLRDSCNTFMSLLHKNDIPLLVFSAGLGDVIHEMFEKHHLVFPNCRVVSNFMTFDPAGKVVGFRDPLIHICNKNRSVLPDDTYSSKEEERTNVILLGDSLNDLQMADGVPDLDQILTIGYLSRHMERLQDFTEGFDIVLIQDETLDVANAILGKIVDSDG
ncbi:PREDICTED: 7-methylguanosine phosphate-specific 5'-nucleotidase A-like [Branchiostoma belcheri]|uniref:5'-nucleotidase n=1 Tax=Branchiostoma belcheri TaxID=7741 RepID=A0A6P5ALL9_BRABE|nr:PREDICTED: 7-methylguanosine phosphate-specific 5'-nucleotidase A-like [Branchiostoma belcheri]